MTPPLDPFGPGLSREMESATVDEIVRWIAFRGFTWHLDCMEGVMTLRIVDFPNTIGRYDSDVGESLADIFRKAIRKFPVESLRPIQPED